MGIDHVIDLDCSPKQTLTPPGILMRLKARERAASVVKLYRDHGDQRPPSEMGFEMVRRMPDGTEDTHVIVVQELLNDAAQLDPLARYCEGCPANRAKRAFGCFDTINYPISRAGELWLLKQLPTPDDPLIFLLLNKTMTDFLFNSEQVREMRARPGVFFETNERFARQLEGAQISTDQVFEMLFMVDRIQPAHSLLLLAFYGAVPRDMDADTLMKLSESGSQHETPFLHQPDPADDDSIRALKAFFEALYTAYRLGVSLSLDA